MYIWNGDRLPLVNREFDREGCHNWKPFFAWLPKKTISNKTVWLKKIYIRKGLGWYGPTWGQNLVGEPLTEYGELFDILKDNG